MLLLKYKKLCALYVVFIVIYLSQILLVTPEKMTLEKYHISTLSLKILALTIALPYIAIWLIALVGYVRLQTYANIIRKDKDGVAFHKIAQGIFCISLWLPLSTIMSNFFTQVYRAHPGMTANLVRLENYLNLIILAAGFWLIYSGSRKLLPLVNKSAFLSSQPVILSYIAFCALYASLVLHDPARETPTATVTVAAYYQPDWLIILTLLIPRLLYWFLGIQAVQNIYLYRTKVKGRLYKAALHNLALGLGSVIAITILLRSLQSASASLVQLSLGPLLAIIYLLLILLSVGYIFIAKGAERLQQFEES